MHLAGTSSWSFAESEAQMLHVALYVRDCFGLPVAADPDVPPRLLADLPDRREVLSAASRAAAGAQWLCWWRQLLDNELSDRDHSGDLDSEHAARARLTRLQDLADPPQFVSLRKRPELRTALVASFEQAIRWESATKRARMTAPGRPRFEWPLVRDAAEDVAFDHSVAHDAIHGKVIVLAVEGSWSHLLRAGAAACSAAVAADPVAAYALLHAVFTSNLP